ncbi:hypothetical protein [Massilia aquatica]|uniref:Uncharacterized protein n=1 Tax=Massilia aquatica TaxID=2609000 RepID=A0ABX0LX30_9BURK|nr:hypothetical protein [Massilia aquatica]NHZ39418.1 hypothetical protein [Massilia aquatica]
MDASTTLFLRDVIIFIYTTSYKVLNGNDTNMQHRQLRAQEINVLDIFTRELLKGFCFLMGCAGVVSSGGCMVFLQQAEDRLISKPRSEIFGSASFRDALMPATADCRCLFRHSIK